MSKYAWAGSTAVERCGICGGVFRGGHDCTGKSRDWGWQQPVTPAPVKKTTEEEILETLKEILKRLPEYTPYVPYIPPYYVPPYNPYVYPPYVVTITTTASNT